MKLSYEMNECIQNTCEDGSNKTRFHSRGPKLPRNKANMCLFSFLTVRERKSKSVPRNEKPQRCACQNDQGKMRLMSRCLESILFYISLVIQLRLRS
jgi:hypothetical protein